MNHIHGHEVMHMMASTGQSYSRDTLRTAINDKFGTETTFFTCSSERLTADQLIDFLQSKGKFHLVDDGFGLDKEQICSH